MQPKLFRIPAEDALRLALEEERVAHADAQLQLARALEREARQAGARAREARASLMRKHNLDGTGAVVIDGPLPTGTVVDPKTGLPLAIPERTPTDEHR
jgi:hypothetical protein